MVDEEEVRSSVVRTRLDVSRGLGCQACIHNRNLRVEDPLIGEKRGMKQNFNTNL